MNACQFLRNQGSAAAVGAALAGVVGLSACGQPSAMGEANSLIVVASDSIWSQVEEDTYGALERTVYTTRDEKIFNVTQTDPASPEINELLLWRQVLVFGTPDDPGVRAIADKAGRSSVDPGELVQAHDVWARGQLATAVVLQPGREVDSWRERLPELSDLLERQFREYVLNRMFVSGVDTATADYLRDHFGFTLEIPHVYQRVEREGGVVLIRNDNPDPSELIRSILIQRGEPVDSMKPQMVYLWRASIDDVQYNVPQDFDVLMGTGRHFELNDSEAVEARGIWKDRAAYPAAGPFIARAVRCGDSVIYMDAWLYSPNPRRSKYEYMMQLEEILDSFKCLS
ncbi:MAG: DUF4837 family protein [Candidatus Palauibacterales bacterium]|nr:DUF4837 family protein [Candidatus Palauibacterales bacterium]